MTLVREKKGEKWYGTKKLEDHYVLIGEPGTCYLRHLTVERGTGNAIASGLYDAIEDMGIADNIIGVGADSTAVNTGPRGGAIRLLECRLGRCLHWFICCLHLNELPLRHLCKQLIGPTEGPTEWKGPLGKSLSTCELLPVTGQFQSITDGDPLPQINTDELSHDQGYLYRIITAVRSGVISDDLVREKPGLMSMARWVTTASRICRLYVGTMNPSSELYTLTHFIVCSYGPMWFKIKCHPNCTDGAKHFVEQVKLQRLLPPVSRKVTWPVIQRNSYWAHHENVLLAMLADEDTAVRRAAVYIIRTVRQLPNTCQQRIRGSGSFDHIK